MLPARPANLKAAKVCFASKPGAGFTRASQYFKHVGSRTAGGNGLKEARFAVNEAGFDVPITMSPEEAERLGHKPFGDGGAEDAPVRKPKVFTHGPCASKLAAEYIVSCKNTSRSPTDLAADALNILRSNGFVVLENLFSAQDVKPLEDEAARFLNEYQDGFIPQPLRAGRTEGHLPFAMPWASSWLLKDEIVLEVVARYMINNLAAGRTQDEQQWALVQWLTSGSDLDWFRRPDAQPKPGPLLDSPPAGCGDVGSASDQGPFFGRISLIKTPGGSPGQKYHRDINFPGPAAQLTIQTPLTSLLANNGPLAYVPGSHRMKTPGYEVIANPPLGSIVMYDSFCEHRGIENHASHDRYAMYYEFETRGVFSGYTATHFGPESGNHMRAFREEVDPDLRRWVHRVEQESSR